MHRAQKRCKHGTTTLHLRTVPRQMRQRVSSRTSSSLTVAAAAGDVEGAMPPSRGELVRRVKQGQGGTGAALYILESSRYVL